MAVDSQTLLAEAKCYLCNGVTLEEALELALLARVASPPPAPVLSFAFPNLHWTFSGTNPEIWSVQGSDDGGITWFEDSSVPGISRSSPFLDSGVLARVVGEDVFGNEIVAPSNSVVIP
jgi:hypothetical protein